MKISYNWLKNYTEIDVSPEELAEILTDTGLEVEGIEKIETIKGGWSGVVVGHVLTCMQHPNADKLKVCTVDIGHQPILSIVCGAPNVAQGQKVAVATVGTTLYPSPESPFKIKKSKIRGVESQGMLCAEDELGIGNNHEGILILPENTTIGENLASILKLENDSVLEIGLTPNRADAMGHIGVLRDYVAFQNVHNRKKLSIQWPATNPILDKPLQSPTEFVDITIQNPKFCPKYSGIALSNITVGDSPEWLQKRLRSIDISPINNIVDITNFVMFELGTPLHAFDVQTIRGKIVVKTATQGERFITLDGVERTLSSDNLMITNGSENLCIAGVLGGLHSGISSQTQSVFIESAYFDPISIRKTAKEHGLSTQASFRYERGTDPSLTEYALKRCASLILEIAGGTVAMNPTVIGSIETKRTISFSYIRNNKLIGADISRQTVDLILKNLDIEVSPSNEDRVQLTVPAYRIDVTRPADVTEEILRIYGFNRIAPPSTMKLSLNTFLQPNPEKVQETTSEFLVGKGFFEVMNNSLTKSTYIEKWATNELSSTQNIPILNPLSTDMNVMRQSLIFGMLETIAHNQNRQHPNVQFFEFGKTYKKHEEYIENKRLILAVSGRKNEENWIDNNDNHDFYSIKGLAMSVLERLGIAHFVKETPLYSTIMSGITIHLLNEKIGDIGKIRSALKNTFGIKNDVFVADLNWDALLSSLKMNRTVYSEIPKTFFVRRDFSLLLDKNIQYAQVEEIAHKTDKKLLKEVGLFDVYEGKNIPEGKKSYAVSFLFQDTQQTLKDAQVDAVMNKIRVNLEQQLGVTLR